MKIKKKYALIIFIIIILFSAALHVNRNAKPKQFYIDSRFISYVVNPNNQDIRFFWKNEYNEEFRNFGNLENWLNSNNKTLLFAMNGGMYKKDFSPQGLYIEDGKFLEPLDTVKDGYGNFYMQPNGVFYIDNDNNARVCETENVKAIKNIKYATQSGPLLLIDGNIHPRFMKGSKNLNIRNGVGILSNGNILFAMSKEKVNLYDFALFFRKNNCRNALYLDGFVSKIYLPSQNWQQTDGEFGVIIAEISDI